MSQVLHTFSSLVALRQALQSKQISATELAQDCLTEIERTKALNAFVHVDADLTLTQARQADALLAAGNAPALTGIPIVIESGPVWTSKPNSLRTGAAFIRASEIIRTLTPLTVRLPPL